MSPWDWRIFPQALSHFKHLEILRIDLENITSIKELSGIGAYRGFTERCMESCPTLSSLTCVACANEQSGEAQLTVSFVRVAALEPSVEIGQPVYVEQSIWRHI